jgi:hypothetical protein
MKTNTICLLFLVVPFGAIQSVADENSYDRVTFHGEWFPLYGKTGTPVSKGNLADAKVKSSDDVCVPVDGSVILDGRLTCRNLYVTGKVQLKPGFQLEAVTILVAATGELTGGDHGQIVFRDAPIDLKLDPFQTGHGLVIWGKTDLRGQAKTPWVEAAGGLESGAKTIRLAARVEGWKVGDELVITDTQQHPKTGDDEKRTEYDVEYVRIQSIDGNVVTIEPPLKHVHREYKHERTGKRLVPHVGNLTRSITLQSENPKGTRGHGIILGRGEGDFRNVAFVGMGRTTSEKLDSAFVPDLAKGCKEVRHIGKNQIGRYAMHYHHAGGVATKHNHLMEKHGHPAARKLTAGRKNRFVVDGCTFNDSRKWGLTIHGTSDGIARKTSSSDRKDRAS